MKVLVSLVLSFFSFFVAIGQDQIKVISYNLLNYGNYTSYCTTTNNNISSKNAILRPIIQYYQPDILGVVELAANSWVVDKLLDSVMNYSEPNKYGRANYSNMSSSDLVSMLFYNKHKFAFAGQIILNPYVRDVLVYSLYYKSPDLAITHDTIWLHCIVAHLKAGSTSADASQRATMVSNIMNGLPQFLPAGNFLIMGDFNVYGSSETCYQGLINPVNQNYKFIDPINKPNWENNYSTHTQSTHSSSNGCASTGGLDDRFDFILASPSIMSGTKKATFVNGSYTAIGNDGNHYNQAITSGTNTSVPPSILNCLYEMSDHLPVMMKIELASTGAGLNSHTDNNFRFWFENPTSDEVLVNFECDLNTSFELSFVDLTGRAQIKKQIIAPTGFSNERISLSNVANGVYFVVVKSKSGFILTQKLLKI